MHEISRAPKLLMVPPLNFSPAEKGLYRSGQPAPINFPFLRRLGLKTIVWLAVEDPSDAFLGFADDHQIEFHHLGLVTEGANPWDQLTESSIVAALNIVLCTDNYPLLVCCGMGRHRTGTVIGCLRRLQGWNLASISEEYRRFVGAKGGRVLIELHIEAFNTATVRPSDRSKVPLWLLPADIEDAAPGPAAVECECDATTAQEENETPKD